MRTKLFIAAIAITMCIHSEAQQKKSDTVWDMIIGEWIGEGSGQPGEGDGICSFTHELDKKSIIRRSHSEYAVNGSNTKLVHEDLLVIYNIDGNTSPQALFIDNEGHVIRYSVTVSEKSAVFISEKSEGSPIFRLTHTIIDNDKLRTVFEMSQDGISFTPYVEGVSRRGE